MENSLDELGSPPELNISPLPDNVLDYMANAPDEIYSAFSSWVDGLVTSYNTFKTEDDKYHKDIVLHTAALARRFYLPQLTELRKEVNSIDIQIQTVRRNSLIEKLALVGGTGIATVAVCTLTEWCKR